MSEGSNKDRLKGLLEGDDGWEANLAKYKEDITELTQDQVVRIEFEHNLAEIQSDIDSLGAERKMSGGRFQADNAETNSNIALANEDYLTQAKEGLGLAQENVTMPVQLQASDDSIAKLTQQLQNHDIGSDEYLEIQAKIENQQELQKELLQIFADEHPEIHAESNIEDVETAFDDFFNKQHHLTVDTELTKDDIESQLNQLKTGSTITFKALTDEGSFQDVLAYKNEDGTITYKADVDGVEQEIQPYTQETGILTLTTKDQTSTGVDTAEGNLGKLPENVNVLLNINHASALQNIAAVDSALNTLANKPSVHKFVYTHYLTTGTKPTDFLLGSAHAAGTAYANGIRNDIPSNVFDDNRYRTAKGETALTGELGRELVVTGNRWFTVGDHGAEFAHIPKGSIVFNHKQTEELLSNGSTNSRGRALASGTAYYKSNTGLDLGKSSNGSGKTTSKNKNKNKNKTSTSKDSAEKFDWIERAVKKLERAIEKLDKTVSATWKKWSDESEELISRNDALTDSIAKSKDEIELQQKAAARYYKEADKVKFTKKEKKYKDKVVNGKISIESIKSEKLRNKIQEYQEWIDKAHEAEDAIADLENDIASKAKEKFENVAAEYEAKLSAKEHELEMLEGAIDNIEKSGHIVTANYYEDMIAIEEGNKKT
jgi:hypothetical protein